jgi:hypothetical protein
MPLLLGLLSVFSCASCLVRPRDTSSPTFLTSVRADAFHPHLILTSVLSRSMWAFLWGLSSCYDERKLAWSLTW